MVGLSGMTRGERSRERRLENAGGMDVKVSASGDGQFDSIASGVVHKFVETLDAK